jgi:hypothetical protein
MRVTIAIALAAGLFSASPSLAMDTKAAGRCVALGAMNQDYRAKAEAVWTVASRTGYGALMEQRAHEELRFVAANKDNTTAMTGWIYQAISACRQF